MVCKFIGWSTANSNCSSWGNYVNVASANYTTLWHSGHGNDTWVYFPSESDTASTISKKGDDTNKWVFPTGIFVTANGKNTAKKNIYDIVGNVWEWTTEIPVYQAEDGKDNAVLRGGSVFDDGSNVLETCRSGGASASSSRDWAFGFRFVLYVK